jgi:hypothetical protein
MGFPKEEIERSTIKHVHISVWQNIIKNVVHLLIKDAVLIFQFDALLEYMCGASCMFVWKQIMRHTYSIP